MAAVHNVTDLVAGDNPADYRVLPVIVRANQSSSTVVQFQCRVVQWVGNVVRRGTELRANRANNYFLWVGPLNNETTNLHVVACLNKGAGGNVSESGDGARFHC